mgnify:CR=1 FL=1
MSGDTVRYLTLLYFIRLFIVYWHLAMTPGENSSCREFFVPGPNPRTIGRVPDGEGNSGPRRGLKDRVHWLPRL